MNQKEFLSAASWPENVRSCNSSSPVQFANDARPACCQLQGFQCRFASAFRFVASMPFGKASQQFAALSQLWNFGNFGGENEKMVITDHHQIVETLKLRVKIFCDQTDIPAYIQTCILYSYRQTPQTQTETEKSCHHSKQPFWFPSLQFASYPGVCLFFLALGEAWESLVTNHLCALCLLCQPRKLKRRSQ